LAFLDLPKDIHGNEYQIEYPKTSKIFSFKLIKIPMNLENKEINEIH